ncbi:MAG: CxxxxCH/CxxCH domain-containing protein [Ignavibacteriaceae bacterium]
MKYYLLNILSAVLLGLFLASCSELDSNISQPQPLTVHKEGVVTPGHANFHGNLIRENGWDMTLCQTCHAKDFSGGTANATCNNCHTSAGGPTACNTCHGSFANPSRIAPPTDLENNTSSSVLGVGAHTKHLYENTLGERARCGSCHIFPSSLYAESHMDNDGRAEVVLKNLAVAHGADNASYNAEDGSCSNTYCHGNFEFYRDSALAKDQFVYTEDKMVGNMASVKWTDSGTPECGSCHGLPPTGHKAYPMSSCYTCHGEVIDENGNIIDKTKHINGLIEARGN